MRFFAASKDIPSVSDMYSAAFVLLSKFFETPAVVKLWAMPSSGLEPETSPLPRECSTAELQGQFKSGPGWI